MKGSRFNLLISSVAIILCLCVCSNSNEKQIDRKQSSNTENIRLAFHEVYRYPEAEFISFLNGIPEIENFTPLLQLDPRLSGSNIIGITSKTEYKDEILKKILKSESLISGSLIAWHREKTINQTFNKEYYKLYLLKDNSEIELNETHISELIVNKSDFEDEFDLVIKFSDEGAVNLQKLTKRLSLDSSNSLAMTINEELFFCAKVNAPLTGGMLTLGGFNTKEEAEQLMNDFKNSR